MNRLMTGSLTVVSVFLTAGSVLAHHSLANYDTTQAVRVKGTIVEVHKINPHSFIFLEETSADGQTRRWAAEGPSLLQLSRTAGAKELPKPGDVVEICGYLPKEPVVWQIANPDPGGRSLSGRLINAETLTLPGGQPQSWGDYGVHKCFEGGFKDQHSTR